MPCYNTATWVDILLVRMGVLLQHIDLGGHPPGEDECHATTHRRALVRMGVTLPIWVGILLVRMDAMLQHTDMGG